jgi:hypothetical protein
MPVSKKRPGRAARSSSWRQASNADKDKGVALYHVMRSDEDFETTADILFQIVKNAAREFPGKPRYLFFDVDGHRNEAGGYDADAYELYSSFIPGYLGQFLTEIPLMKGRARRAGQSEDVPDHLVISPGGSSEGRMERLREQASRTGMPVWDADSGSTVHLDGTIASPAQAGPIEE